ncbi:MAG: hypothetical protein KJP04_00165, partial [Arenicella sp.]|nr:hypothetical protein [Arenicella sp.]
MSEVKTYPVKESIKATTHINAEQYAEMYRRSLQDNDSFWAEQAELHLDWYEKWHTVSRQDFHKAEIAWFEGGKLNLTVNCIDRHLPERAADTAIIWEGDDPGQSEHISYQTLHD